jgi:Arc/MetJ-type ribon-helix-helix transcriptional regulator
MTSEDDYVTVRIPRKLADDVDEVIRSGTLGYRSRAEMVNEAIRLRIKQIRFGGEKDESLSAQVKEALLAHAIISIVKGKTMPSHHQDLKKLEQNIKRYINKSALMKNRKITEKNLDVLSKEILEYHKNLLKELALITP